MFQSGTSKSGRGSTRKPATVFTEQGVAMLTSVLHSPRVVVVTIAIIRASVQLRELLASHRQRDTKRGWAAHFTFSRPLRRRPG
jgi:hypothetical protein